MWVVGVVAQGNPPTTGLVRRVEVGRYMIMKIIGVPINQVFGAHLVIGPAHQAWPHVQSRGHPASYLLSPSLLPIHVPTMDNAARSSLV